MSNNKGLLITNNNIYGLVNPPPKPTRRDGAGPHHDISSAAVRWDVFVDFSNNFVGNLGSGGGGAGSVNAGKYGEDSSGNYISVAPKRDISGIYFDLNKFDVSFNTVSGKENIYVALKPSGGNVTQDYIDELFFDPPKAITNENIDLVTTGGPPRLDASWNNPTQIRAAFDFLGTSGPKADNSDLVNNNDESRDDYNFLPYHQGLKIQYLCYNQDGTVVGNGHDWQDVPFANLVSLPASSGVSYWNNTNGENFLPRFIKKIRVYTSTSASQITPNPSNGIVIFPDFGGNANFPPSESSSYVFSLPDPIPNTLPSVTSNGKKLQFRVAMINRARASIIDPSYNTGHGLSSQDVSWNWVYMPDISGIAIGNYGTPTAPLTFITPTNPSPFHDRFTLSGRNDNDGTGTAPGDADTANAVVETGLSTPFSSLINPPINPSLPKVQYRYDLSGHRLSNSKQIDGNTTDIDLSRNLPEGAPSVWFPSTTNQNTVPNTWSDTITRTENKVFPEHTYDIYRYSMRHNLDPSGVSAPNIYTDASSATVVNSISAWNTPVPPRSAATKNDANNGYLDTLPDYEDTTIWQQSNDTSWAYGDYFVGAGAIKAFLSTGGIKTDLLFLNNGLDPSKNIATTIQSNSSYDVKIRANSDDLLGIDASGVEIIRMRSNIFIDGTTTSHTTDLDLSGVQLGFQGTHDLSGGYSLGAKGTDVSNNFLGWKTSDIVNAFDNGNIIQEGGYYCGTELSDIDISNVNLTNYEDISNNSLQAGYKVIIYQELSGNSANWTRHPQSGDGWHKIFNIATRPIEDITLSVTSSDFEIRDGYNGLSFASYNNSNNNFKFGAEPKGENPTANFFGLPILAKTSTNIVEYTISLENLDATWWPTDGNLIENLEFFIQGSGSGTAPGPSNYINWSNQSITKSWVIPLGTVSPYPNVAASPNTTQDLSGTFDLSGNTASNVDFKDNKYSRNLLPITYSSSILSPLFLIQGTFDNNILRLKRGNTTNALEAGSRRTIDDSFSGGVRKNRFEGNGVGPGGNLTLFWDYTFDSTVSLNNVGDINLSSTYFSEYPFVDAGQAPDYTTSYDHTVLLHNGITAATGAERQLIWAADGFKSGGGSGIKNPYVDYNSNYWFGDRTGTRTPNYNPLMNLGETLSLTARTFTDTNAGGQFKWWDDTGTGFIMNSNLKYKFIVIKCPIPAMTLPSGGFTGVTISTKNAGSTSFDILPIDNSANLVAGQGSASNPICWWQEFGTLLTHPTSSSNQTVPFTGPGKTGWKATHKTFNTGLGPKSNNNNGAGSLWGTGYSLGRGKIHRIYGNVGAAGAFDIYFRIGLPNQGSYSIKEVEVQFKYISSGANGNTVTDVPGANAKQTFEFYKS